MINNMYNVPDNFCVEKKVETVYNSSPVISFIWKAEKNWPVESVSGSISQLGYIPDDFLSGRYSYEDIVHPEDVERVHMEVEKHSKKKNTSFFTLDYRILTKSGDTCWVTERSFIKRDTEGNISHFQGIIIDNTELERTEKELMETEKKYKTIFEKCPVGIVYFDEAGVITHCNESCARVFKAPLNRIIGFNILTKLPDDKLREAVEMVFLGNLGHYTGNHISAISGRKVFLKAVFTPLMSDDGALMGGIGIIEDMEGYTRTEELIRLNEERLEALFELGQMQGSPLTDIAWHTLKKAVELSGSNEGYLEIVGGGIKNRESYHWALSRSDGVVVTDDSFTFPVCPHVLRREIIGTRKAFIISNDRQYDEEAFTDGNAGVPVRYVAVPVFEREQVVALLCVANKASDYDYSDVRQLTLLIRSMWDLIEHMHSADVRTEANNIRRVFESVLSSLPAVVFIWRPEKNWPVEFVSDNISQFGYKVEDFTSGKILYGDIIHPLDLDRVKREVDRAYKEGFSDFSNEYRILTKTGQVRWVDERTTIHHDRRGAVSYLQGVFVDITERRQANSFMQLECDITGLFDTKDGPQEAFKKVMDFIMDIKAINCGAIFMVDGDTGEFALSAAYGLAERYIGTMSVFPANSLFARLFMLGHPVYRNYSDIRSMIPEIGLALEDLQAMGFIPVNSNGQLIAGIVLGSYDELEIPANSRNLLENISEQMGTIVSDMRKDNKIKKSKEHLKSLLDAIDDLAFIMNSDGRILHTNNKLQVCLNYGNRDLHMEDFLRLFQPEKGDEVLSTLDDIMSGRSFFCDVPLISKDGVIIPARTKFIIGDFGEQDALIVLSQKT